MRLYITDELYKRKKHPFLAPTQWPKDGPLHRKFKGLLTQEAVDGLGFVDHGGDSESNGECLGRDSRPESIPILTLLWFLGDPKPTYGRGKSGGN